MGGAGKEIDRLEPLRFPKIRERDKIAGEGGRITGKVKDPHKRMRLCQKGPGIRAEPSPWRIDQTCGGSRPQPGERIFHFILESPLQKLRPPDVPAKNLHCGRMGLHRDKVFAGRHQGGGKKSGSRIALQHRLHPGGHRLYHQFFQGVSQGPVGLVECLPPHLVGPDGVMRAGTGSRTKMGQLGVDVLRRQQAPGNIHQGPSIHPKETDFSLPVVDGDPVPVSIIGPGEDGAEDRVPDFSDPGQGRLDLGHLDPCFGGIGKMLRGASAAVSKKGTGCGHPVRGRFQYLQESGTGEILVPFRQLRKDPLAGCGKGNENYLALMTGNAVSAVGNLVYAKFNGRGSARNRMLQYQFSFRSAGGTGST